MRDDLSRRPGVWPLIYNRPFLRQPVEQIRQHRRSPLQNWNRLLEIEIHISLSIVQYLNDNALDRSPDTFPIIHELLSLG